MKTAVTQRGPGADILLTALSDPVYAAGMGPETWDLLLRVARSNRLLGRLAVVMDEMGLTARLPGTVVDHFIAARAVLEHRQRAARWEINRILEALEGMDAPLVLLKGCAYLLADLPPARGRLFSDVDLLVPSEALGDVEHALKKSGWGNVKLEDYDQRYYRTWMHELPPLRHPEHALEVDIHHTISPLTSRLNPDPEKLFLDSVALDDARLRVLQPVDMVLHSAVHLFYDGEFINGLRDLVDLADLFTHFGGSTAFWEELVLRAREQDMQRPLFYAMRYVQLLLGTGIPVVAMTDIGTAGPPRLILKLMDWLVAAAIVPDHPDFPKRRTALAKWLLYVRSHWLRMPPLMLVKHLARKQVMRWRQGKIKS